jgi:hypothetical protein
MRSSRNTPNEVRSCCAIMWLMMMSFICSCKNKNQPTAIYPKGTSHHTRLFRGPSTNGMKSRMVLAAPDPLLTPPPSSSICANLLTTGPVSVTPCAHWFHTECIEAWIQTKSRYNKNCNCPLCNQEIPVISSLTPQSHGGFCRTAVDNCFHNFLCTLTNRPTTGCREDRCPVVSNRPLHSRAAAKMPPHIRICPDPVLADHAPSPPVADRHCLQRRFSSPLRNRIFEKLLTLTLVFFILINASCKYETMELDVRSCSLVLILSISFALTLELHKLCNRYCVSVSVYTLMYFKDMIHDHCRCITRYFIFRCFSPRRPLCMS